MKQEDPEVEEIKEVIEFLIDLNLEKEGAKFIDLVNDLTGYLLERQLNGKISKDIPIKSCILPQIENKEMKIFFLDPLGEYLSVSSLSIQEVKEE